MSLEKKFHYIKKKTKNEWSNGAQLEPGEQTGRYRRLSSSSSSHTHGWSKVRPLLEVSLWCFIVDYILLGSIYIPSQGNTHFEQAEEIVFFSLLLLQHPSSSIHDAHFLCLRRLFSSFAFLIRFFYSYSGFFFLLFELHPCCVCVLRWIRIASCFFYRLLRRFFCFVLFCWSFSLFCPWIPFLL